MPTHYDFVIPVRLLTLNKLLRMHFVARAKYQRNLAWEVRAAAGVPPRVPMRKCRIIVERHSTQEPDPDGIRSCAKGLLDVLQPCSMRHPVGLGYIAEDNSSCVTHLQVMHVQDKAEKTRVIITEVEP